ncbi:MAG: PAS domain-containing sensor histidine kinase [Chloroflexota bacterium]
MSTKWDNPQENNKLNPMPKMVTHLAGLVTDGVLVLDDETNIIFANNAISDILGYRPRDLVGQPIDMLTQETLSDDMTAFMVKALSNEAQASSWQGIRMHGQHQNGTSIPIEITIDMLSEDDTSYCFVLLKDVREQVTIEQELQADATRYLQILDAIPDIICVKDLGSRLIWANQAFRKFYNVSLEDLVGEIQYGSQAPKDIILGDQTVLNSEWVIYEFEETITRHDSVERTFMTTKTLIYDSSQQANLLLSVSSDITSAKTIERYLTEALRQREELVELRTNFVSMVSHEFRTPLSVILSSADILRTYHDRLTNERRDEKLATIHEQVQRLTELMDQILLINKGDAQGLPFVTQPTDIVGLSNSIIEEVQMIHRTNNVNVRFNYTNGDTYLPIDPNLYRHILQNLVSNAIKYSRPHAEVSVKINASDKQMTLAVADTGIGIPKENQANLFQTFHRADNVGTIHGTGLGLAIVKRAVETHGGTINFRSIENQGTLFVVTLPLNSSTMYEEQS